MIIAVDEEKFWDLLSVQLTGEATPEELITLEDYLLLHPELQPCVHQLRQLWKCICKKTNHE
ncbi:MAG: hypothetical protein QM726_10300 [Chitinophagaceae bacterium]